MVLCGIIKYRILYSGKISSRKLKLMHRNEIELEMVPLKTQENIA
jgi:hypothetical protein